MSADTIAALATPHGRSALAVIRISGELSLQIASKIFNRPESGISHRTSTFAQYTSISGNLVDDVVFTFFKSPFSFTGEDSIEITSHGNPIIIKKILEDLCMRGCRMADRGEFTRRAFLNKKIDLCQAEAVADIIHSSSERALKVAQRQMSGQMSQQLLDINDELLSALVLTETNIDFSDEDIDFSLASSNILIEKLTKISNNIQTLISSNKYRDILDEGIKVVILGEPNAGKSSLLNVLLGTDRALVSDIPGTTRDFITEKISIGEDVIRIVDTAGLRDAPSSSLEQTGITKTMQEAKHADFYLLVIDSNKEYPKLPQEVISKINPTNTLVILNKCDLPKNNSTLDMLKEFDTIHVQLNTDQFADAIKEKLNDSLKKNDIVPDETSIVINSRHSDILQRTKFSVDTAIKLVKNIGNIELIASDIRTSLETLGEITGTYNTEDMLDKLFSSFCIGK